MILPLRADERNWLPPGSMTDITRDPPAELIRQDTVRDKQWLYGRLLFHSPALLGERAVRIGLSCNSCHTNGHINADFYIEGLSDRPGRVDVTHRFWQAGFDDGKDNPLDIPTLRGIRDSAPYGTAVRLPDLPSFTRHVIVTEFAGPEPNSGDLDALIHYLASLMDTPPAHADEAQQSGPETSYLTLLAGPVETENFHEVDRLYELIRSDYGRRIAKMDTIPASLRNEVTLLKSLHEKAAADDFAAARVSYQALIARQ
ncbi:hypothetical protein [Sneathiella sp.]|uniref:hypothetical protein n=1 Tax=Sneathiella sp. TaxID=1964365 RepID=UPI0025D1C19F|nr:hypothetical protein [Sneathiella sp.]